jgi:tetratricopeptide (TPR) repeat protein
MNRRLLIGVVGLLVLVGAALLWRTLHDERAAEASDAPDMTESLPIPPVPPRIAEGEDYEKCLAMLASDPAGANSFADAWEATGGGEGAQHCHALAQVALGDVEAGAGMLEKLAGSSHAPAAARATVYGQADQAWLMAGKPDRALGAASAALALSGEDADLLIDRSVAAATLGHYDDAIDDLTHALDVDGKRADALVLRAAAWRQTGHLDLAQDDIDRAFVLDPENPEAFLERGILRQRRGDRAGAHTDWEQAMALAPDTATSDLAEQNLALLEAGPERR